MGKPFLHLANWLTVHNLHSRYHCASCVCLRLQFDYYTFVDKDAMYRVGSLFYALYFVVSFPMFFR